MLTVHHFEAWAGDGNSTVKVVDLISQTTTDTISTGGTSRADELCYDPRDEIVAIANDADSPPFFTFISTKPGHAVLGKIVMDGGSGPGHGPKATDGIEQCQWDRKTGKIYLNLPEVNGSGHNTSPGEVLVIDPRDERIERSYVIPIADCAGPQGMALGPDGQIALGCNTTSSSVVIDSSDGHVIATLAGEGGTDEAWFNDGDDHYFFADSSATTPNLGVVNSGERDNPSIDSSTTVNTLVTGASAHSVAADPVKNQVYVPIKGATSTVCSSVGGSDANGCVAVYTTTDDDAGQQQAWWGH